MSKKTLEFLVSIGVLKLGIMRAVERWDAGVSVQFAKTRSEPSVLHVVSTYSGLPDSGSTVAIFAVI